MPEWLTSTDIIDPSVPPQTLAVRLLVSLAFGLCVSGIYRISHGRHHGNPAALGTTLVLLSVLIAMVSMTIGNSVARAFSLVGALSIVRFRTVVDDTRDTAFVILSVIVGMASGAGLLLLPVVGLPIVGVTAVALSRWPWRGKGNNGAGHCRLTIRLALGRDPAQTLEHVLQRSLANVGLVEVATARQGAALDLTYVGQLLPQSSLTQFVSELNQVEGVMGVELHLN
ncbi:DUF4956 domain-containing protein [Planctomicrobium piriforme]|uniref:Mg2+ transporter-C (MgtC) family protein n=1 Tax=Planctomicrobium piriforme TaxID=1576369 RepID=A0A1I3C226_9PLAN|nr:DUF4956 domain-containing protein [Planctomicrobium piriforme]SFH68658.1 protein of unknown function [Planctomicrobium piriforme]